MTKWTRCASSPGKIKKAAGFIHAVNSACCVTVDPWAEKAACAINARVYLQGFGTVVGSGASLATMKAAADELFWPIGTGVYYIFRQARQRFVKLSGFVDGQAQVQEDWSSEIAAAVDFKALHAVVKTINTLIQGSGNLSGTLRLGQGDAPNEKANAESAYAASSPVAVAGASLPGDITWGIFTGAAAVGPGWGGHTLVRYDGAGPGLTFAKRWVYDYTAWVHWTPLTVSVSEYLWRGVGSLLSVAAWAPHTVAAGRSIVEADVVSVGGEPAGNTWGYTAFAFRDRTAVWPVFPFTQTAGQDSDGTAALVHTFSIPDGVCVPERLRYNEAAI